MPQKIIDDYLLHRSSILKCPFYRLNVLLQVLIYLQSRFASQAYNTFVLPPTHACDVLCEVLIKYLSKKKSYCLQWKSVKHSDKNYLSNCEWRLGSSSRNRFDGQSLHTELTNILVDQGILVRIQNKNETSHKFLIVL